MSITVTYTNSAGTAVQTSKIRWTSMTHWKQTPMSTHVSVAGARGKGVNFPQGWDNAVATISGIVYWNADGIAELDALDNATVTVTEPVEGTHTGLATISIGNGGSTAWIQFTMSVTEDKL